MQGSMVLRRAKEIADRLLSDLHHKHAYSAEHSLAVEQETEQLLSAISHPWNEQDVAWLLLGARFHDIGKLRIPNVILDKPGKLTEEEFGIIKTHPSLGVEILQQVGLVCPQIVWDVVRHHHESFFRNGYGYPIGMFGEDIPLAARIVAIADTSHALMSVRSYKDAMSPEKAAGVLREMARTKLDPILTRTFVDQVLAVAA